MTTGFDTQPVTFGHIVKTAPKPQILGAKIEPQKATPDARLPEPRSFGTRPRL